MPVALDDPPLLIAPDPPWNGKAATPAPANLLSNVPSGRSRITTAWLACRPGSHRHPETNSPLVATEGATAFIDEREGKGKAKR
ncbi:MAG: hypothetical protein IT518_19095 [Burkholderiales bacterium]|nr:hypothetical protein [Burkholderiales bacterium]